MASVLDRASRDRKERQQTSQFRLGAETNKTEVKDEGG